mgnify:CR=1 FL=1
MNMIIDKNMFDAKIIENNNNTVTLKIELKINKYATDKVNYWDRKCADAYMKENFSKKITNCINFSSTVLSSTPIDNIPFAGEWTYQIKTEPPPQKKTPPRKRTRQPRKKSFKARVSGVAAKCETRRKEEG